MNKKTVVYNNDMDFVKIGALLDEGIDVLCPICASKLVIIRTIADSSRHGADTGVFCPTNKIHLNMQLSQHFDETFWDQFSK